MSFISRLTKTATEYGFLKELSQITVTLYPYRNSLHAASNHDAEGTLAFVESQRIVMDYESLLKATNICEVCTLNYTLANNIVDPNLSDFFKAFFALYLEGESQERVPQSPMTLEDLVMLSNYFAPENNEHSEDVMQAYFIMENINSQTAQKIFLELVEDINIKHKKLLLDNPGIEIFLKSLLKESYKDDDKICYVALSPSKIRTPKENELIEVNNWYGAIKRYDIGMAIASIYIRDFPQYQAMLQAPMYITRLLNEYSPSLLASKIYAIEDADNVLQAGKLWSKEINEVYFDFDKAYEAITLV